MPKTEIRHFLPEGSETTSCGLNQFKHDRILLTQFYNPEVRSVTCKRCLKELSKPKVIAAYKPHLKEPVGYFKIVGVAPDLVSFGTSIYQLHKKFGLIQNDCYIMLGVAVRQSVFHNKKP